MISSLFKLKVTEPIMGCEFHNPFCLKRHGRNWPRRPPDRSIWEKMSNEKINQMTREEWRDLGFYYDQDETKWIFVGSNSGLQNFCILLEKYAGNKKHNVISEHDHFGPYFYLKITTWDRPVITKDAIYGRLIDFMNLSAIIKGKLNQGKSPFVIDKEYSHENELTLLFEIKEDGFDPASIDPLLNE